MAHILVAEDSVAIVEMIATTLEEAGHEVVPARDGAVALAMCQRQEFDLVISDLNMPNVDGLKLVAALRTREKYRDVPIMMLTMDADRDKMRKAAEAGVTSWLLKPFHPDRLQRIVDELLAASP